MSARLFLAVLLLAASAAGPFLRAQTAAAASTAHPVSDSARFKYVLDLPRQYVNDHSLFRAGDQWHLYFILGDQLIDTSKGGSYPPDDGRSPFPVLVFDGATLAAPGTWSRDGNEITIGHATSPDLVNWTVQPPALTIGPKGSIDAGHVYAPAVIERDSLYYMMYTATDGSHFRAEHLCLAISTDLYTWRRVGEGPVLRPDPSWALYYAPGKIPGRAGPVSGRDPFLYYDPSYGYLCYYVARLKQDPRNGTTDGELSAVAVATSPDLLNWTDRGPVLTRRTVGGDSHFGWTHPESPCLVRYGATWFLFWKSGSGTHVAMSDDPFDFSNSADYFIATSHASRIVEHNGIWHITSCSRSIDDFAHKWSDRTRGLFIAGIDWRWIVPLVRTVEEVAAVEAETAAAGPRLVPNSVRTGDPVQLQLAAPAAPGARLRVVDIRGNELLRRQIRPIANGPDGTAVVAVPTEHLSPGVYLVVVENDSQTRTMRLIVR